MEALLLVPAKLASAALGKTSNKTGNWMRPPPPATASTNPAKNAATTQMAITESAIS